jgi:hypothetical protein
MRFADLRVSLLASGGTAVTVRHIEYSCQKEACRDGNRLADQPRVRLPEPARDVDAAGQPRTSGLP